MAEENDTNIAENAEGKPKKKRLLVVGLIVLLLAGAGGGAALFLAGGGETGDEAAEPAVAQDAPPQYFAIEPALVVNFEQASRVRYLQVKLEVMARDKAALDAVQQHMPVIRNNLNLLFSQQDPAVLATREGKETLQQQAVAEIQQVLAAQGATATVEQVYFTSFVMQ
ncbi:MAG: flagellar basal body-associated FliL family protein [Gammaproteobacteria bacterium]|nr:flagellar basal body-associated FliL family protein [Gammaproteobacteria bacterium]MDX5374332.1 flagellar basal body-associated FliL family protein [Gammaproteobacteria bacterium]